MLYRGFLRVENGLYRHLYFDSNSTPRYPRYQGIIITRGLSPPPCLWARNADLIWLFCLGWGILYLLLYIWFVPNPFKKARTKTQYSGPLTVRLSLMSPPIQPYHSAGFFNEKGGTSAQKGVWVEGPDWRHRLPENPACEGSRFNSLKCVHRVRLCFTLSRRLYRRISLSSGSRSWSSRLMSLACGNFPVFFKVASLEK